VLTKTKPSKHCEPKLNVVIISTEYKTISYNTSDLVSKVEAITASVYKTVPNKNRPNAMPWIISILVLTCPHRFVSENSYFICPVTRSNNTPDTIRVRFMQISIAEATDLSHRTV